MVTRIRFALADAAGIRFGISPLWETVRSLYALGDPGRHAIHVPWVRRVRNLCGDPAVAGALDLLGEFARPGSWLPDFLTPAPSGPLVELADELVTLAATPVARIRADLRAIAVRRPLGPAGLAGLRRPGQLRSELVGAVRIWYEAAIAPDWPRLRALLEADIGYRGRQLAEGGLPKLFSGLHPSVRWAGDGIHAEDPWGLDIDLRGRGLPLMPSVFVDRRVLWAVRPDSPPLAVYPARAAATLWQSRPAPSAALVGVLGPTRARLLEMLGEPASTTELARRLNVAPPSVSGQLGILRAAGLVSRAPAGRSVLYLRTELAERLLAGG
ncbi:MAG TPA: helix-turn-helix domain-containing protein [Jiangellales bacterium]|nr:helix-turn-helix domain-containing protein [Jiangellales bacterium]